MWLLGRECLGLPRLVHKSVSACPIDVRSRLYDKIIMAGGTTRMPGDQRQPQPSLPSHARIPVDIRLSWLGRDDMEIMIFSAWSLFSPAFCSCLSLYSLQVCLFLFLLFYVLFLSFLYSSLLVFCSFFIHFFICSLRFASAGALPPP